MQTPVNPTSDLLILLYDVARHMRTYSDHVAAKHGMTRAQRIILSRLERQPNLSQSELAALAQVSPITVARLIDRLEALGLVARCTDPDDRRIWRLRLTPAAAPVLREIKDFRARFSGLMTKDIAAPAIDAMASGLTADEGKRDAATAQCCGRRGACRCLT